MEKIRSSEITPEHLYLSRRRFLKGAALLAGAASLAACAPLKPAATAEPTPPGLSVSRQTDELENKINSYEDITHYNNYYEFTTLKQDVAEKSKNFVTSPWQVEVSGFVRNPKTFDIEDLRKKYDQEERIYRLRCVEGWSMVIPWMGFPLSKLLNEVEPTIEAKYVRFTTVLDPKQMPGQSAGWYRWPYVEGLRLDEAMHDLTILATGLYGKTLLPQNGAPVRLVVPWKYGFKSIKGIVKIELVDAMPDSFWMATQGEEYGFYANVNPKVPHPRWSQATERRIGISQRIPTLMFNGYKQVDPLYEGLDLRLWY